MTSEPSETTKIIIEGEPLERLTPEHIRQIDEMLVEIGAAGELRLTIRESELRYQIRGAMPPDSSVGM